MVARIVAVFLVILSTCIAFEFAIQGGQVPASVDILDQRGAATPHIGGPVSLYPEQVAIVRVTTELPGIGGTAVLSVTVDGDDVEVFIEQSRSTIIADGTPQRVVIHASEDGTAKALIVATSAAATLRDVRVDSLNRHQMIWPTRIGILACLVLFLPIALAIGFVPAGQTRRNLMLAASLVFIGALSLSLLEIVGSIVVLGYLVALAVARRSLAYFSALGILVIPLILFKIMGPIALAGFDLTVQTIWLPIGLSYLVARQIDLAMKIAMGQQTLPSIRDYLFFSVFWPSFSAGPITQYDQNFVEGEAHITWTSRALGGRRISVGLAKKVFADLIFLMLVTENYHAVVVTGEAAPEIRLAFYFGNMLFVFFDFSGYTDIALGTARWMGIRLPENFDNPLLRWNMRDFWRHWHMSLTQWVNRIVYMPLSMAVRRQGHVVKYYVPIVATTLTIGLWHGFALGWFFWALHHALGVIIADWWIKLDGRYFTAPGRHWGRKMYRGAGIVFVWYWLMLSYTFTLSSNITISFREYALVLAAPLQIALNNLGV
jgi:alginate O-acetyltransferase complex protein AlgI